MNGPSYLEQYARAILSGKIATGRRIKQQMRHLLDKIEHPEKYEPYIFDTAVADHHIEFIEKFCKQSQGRRGEPLALELFQKARLEAIFGFVDKNTGYRQYNEVLIIEGRKNGKTTETAAIELDMLLNDGAGAPEIYNIATRLEQAKKGFVECWNMQRNSTAIRKLVRKRQNDLFCAVNLGFIKPLAADTNGLDGLNAQMVVIDELAAIKNRDIYDLMKQSMGAGTRPQPLLFCISTNGFVRGGIFDDQYKYACNILDGKAENVHFLSFIYELDDREEWKNPDAWIKANPGLGTIKKVSFLRECVQKAKDDPAFLPTVLVKDFNFPENRSSAWLQWQHIHNDFEADLEKLHLRYGVGGFDAADSVDLNAAVALGMIPGDPHIYARDMFWLPEDVLAAQTTDGNRRERDEAPYLLWERQGLLRSYPGSKVDKHVFLDWFRELRDDDDFYIIYIAYDPWHIDDTLLREFKQEFGERCMIPVRQGSLTLSAPMKELKADLAAGRIVHNNNPVLQMCLTNTEVLADTNGNIKPIKGIDLTQRIDGTIALICAYIALINHYDDLQAVI